MKRIVELELMEDSEQAVAYVNADFTQAHSSYVRLFGEFFPEGPIEARVLDVGCGPCDVTIRFADAYPRFTFHAVDGSSAMLEQARHALARRPDVASRIALIEGQVPDVALPDEAYDVIVCSSVLHHLHDPDVLWQTVRTRSRAGTRVFVADLFRPESPELAQEIVERYAGGEPGILKRDFYNSLLAAFTPNEIRRQMRAAGLDHLETRIISDRHLVVFGTAP